MCGRVVVVVVTVGWGAGAGSLHGMPCWRGHSPAPPHTPRTTHALVHCRGCAAPLLTPPPPPPFVAAWPSVHGGALFMLYARRRWPLTSSARASSRLLRTRTSWRRRWRGWPRAWSRTTTDPLFSSIMDARSMPVTTRLHTQLVEVVHAAAHGVSSGCPAGPGPGRVLSIGRWPMMPVRHPSLDRHHPMCASCSLPSSSTAANSHPVMMSGDYDVRYPQSSLPILAARPFPAITPRVV